MTVETTAFSICESKRAFIFELKFIMAIILIDILIDIAVLVNVTTTNIIHESLRIKGNYSTPRKFAEHEKKHFIFHLWPMEFMEQVINCFCGHLNSDHSECVIGHEYNHKYRL